MAIANAPGQLRRQIEADLEFAQQHGSKIAGDQRFVETGFDAKFFQRPKFQLLVVFEVDIILPCKFKKRNITRYRINICSKNKKFYE